MGEQLKFETLEVNQTPPEQTQQATEQNLNIPEPEKQKGKRGRKAGVPNKPKEPNVSGNDEDFFSKASQAANEKKQETQQQQQQQPSIEAAAEKPSLITGYMLLVICDAVIPSLISRFIAKKTGTKKQIKKLDKTQLDEMRPLADAAAKKMFENVSEVPAFFIAYACVTFSNQVE